MTIQHRTVDIEASAKLWSEGLSASQIASRFGVSRNVVIGIAYRNRDRFPPRQKRKLALSTRKPTGRAREHAPELPPEPEIPATAYDAERLQSAKLLHHLSAGECCWPLNTGGPYRFCAAETTGRYCRNHHARSLPKKNEGKA
ncbi:GcrA family cell cycle regulator [Sinorhizobium meliloti]|uniref:GcrA family cell cycle regulator n=1 Tax=Rhizobium meliloti TaxID=382 RepID=UPI000FD72028|nr:GcrA family cell cycle regulator [Sinorhizobium meliloti]RVG81331.1 GcrA cell cycle regulator [Sinorhizobium meliloti]RVI36949.1 GcrA cell cycle regulator [Sinorhizobium meliloti]RVI47069.1 GcrA cell cycle regulator [Sinorhizobium meliloti]RVJ23895.1 GcrA cell cycle regulator [Sinorhizobium meliloti]RVJ94808.1 GcrA cell cycle regulator [Sinorhizobium meliloti]